MKYLKQFLLILVVTFIGEILHYFIPAPIPASIYGMVLMFILLETGILPEDSIKETGKFLVEIMPVMFVPAVVGILPSWGIIRPSLFAYALVTVVTTFIVMAASGAVTQFVMDRKKKECPEKTAENGGEGSV